MRRTTRLSAVFWFFAPALALGDEVLYRYEGDMLPYADHENAGWLNGNPCDPPCTDSIEDGRYVLRWPGNDDQVGYALFIATSDTPPPPPTLWVEWRFRSDHAIGPFFTCDGAFVVDYGGIHEVIYMHADAVIEFTGSYGLIGLDVQEPHTLRFESLDGINYHVAVDGTVFLVDADDNFNDVHFLSMRGCGCCEGQPITNEWDYVRYGTISSGERVIATDPPMGDLDPLQHFNLDRFTVTFDAANYVYIDDIKVEVTGGEAPVVIATRRRENDEPDTVEIVLDRPLTVGETTRFIFKDGATANIVDYNLGGPDIPPIPAVSHWGLVALTLVLLSAGTIARRRRTAQPVE